MTTIKKALILSFFIHIVGLLGGEIVLRRTKPDRKQVLYPIRLIQIAESSPKPTVRSSDSRISQPKPKIKQEPKAAEKKKTPEPKKGVEVKKEKEKKKPPIQQKKRQEKIKKEVEKAISKADAEKIDKAIEQIKHTLKERKKEESPLISKDFIELQKQLYASMIDRLIKENWSIPKNFLNQITELEAIIIICIKSNGELAETRLEKRSGFHPFDESAIRAIKKAAPFPPPPVELKDEEFEIRFYSNQIG